MLLRHCEVTDVIKMVVGEKDDREVQKVGKVVYQGGEEGFKC